MSKKIIVNTGETFVLAPGANRFESMELDDNATLVFSNSTTLFVDELITGVGSRIVYQSQDYRDDTVFTLYSLDASGVNELHLVGNGKHGQDQLQPAPDGPNGRNARDPQLFKTSGNKASPGGPGSPGQAGGTGEDAADFVLNLPYIAAGAEITVEGIGGKGGRGQDGGRGGRGGNRSTFHDGRNGGPGGAGGPGGPGGDAAKTHIFFVVTDDEIDDEDAKSEIQKKTTLLVNTSPGDGGSGGSGGAGGQPGKAALIGPGGKQAGAVGADGADGVQGDGPKPGQVQDAFVKIDFFAESDYRAYLAQIFA